MWEAGNPFTEPADADARAAAAGLGHGLPGMHARDSRDDRQAQAVLDLPVDRAAAGVAPEEAVIPHAPVRQWVLSLTIPLRVLLAAQP